MSICSMTYIGRVFFDTVHSYDTRYMIYDSLLLPLARKLNGFALSGVRATTEISFFFQFFFCETAFDAYSGVL